MSKKPDSTIFFMEEQWSFIFKMRRKNYFDKANYTFKYYINPERTKILEVSHAKDDIKTCPIFIDEIITCYCNSDYFKTFDSWKLLDVINNSFKNSCQKCEYSKNNKCEFWEYWGNGNSLLSDGVPIIFKEINSLYDLYQINNEL